MERFFFNLFLGGQDPKKDELRIKIVTFNFFVFYDLFGFTVLNRNMGLTTGMLIQHVNPIHFMPLIYLRYLLSKASYLLVVVLTTCYLRPPM